jgi:hypothetical protein
LKSRAKLFEILLTCCKIHAIVRDKKIITSEENHNTYLLNFEDEDRTRN